jgi:hypothetical protein
MANLRQKTWGIFIKPYIEYSGDKLVQKGNLSVSHPCQADSHVTVQGGEAYMLYATSTSFIELREKVKECMDELGYSKNDILIVEMITFDHIVTPLT